MRKIIIYIALFVCSFLWFLGCSKDIAGDLFKAKILKDDFRYGDLYRLSNLAGFKELQVKCESKKGRVKSDVSLFIAGDSFTEKERVDSSDFAVKNYKRIFVSNPESSLKLNSGRNILIIETVERHFRERFVSPYKVIKIGEENSEIVEVSLKDDLMNYALPYSETHHQASLFGFDFILKIKEFKAALNQYLFNKVDNRVYLSKDKKHIFYYLDREKGLTSGFESVSDSAVNQMIVNINETYSYYKSKGFDEVYLSIIPNKSSIIEPGNTYNNIIEKIESRANLRMPVISLLKDYKSGGASVYAISDSHWNCQGRQIWLDKVHEKLSQK
jgi:hypothetical protein